VERRFPKRCKGGGDAEVRKKAVERGQLEKKREESSIEDCHSIGSTTPDS